MHLYRPCSFAGGKGLGTGHGNAPIAGCSPRESRREEERREEEGGRVWEGRASQGNEASKPEGQLENV